MAALGALRGLVVFLTWTVTSFLCHYFAKSFLRGAAPTMGALGPACLVTSLQATMCYCLTDVRIPGTGQHLGRARRVFLVKASTHVLATLATNYSLACMQAASTMAVKLLEPLTSALVQWLVLGLRLSPAGLASLPLVVAGAAVFVGGPGGGTGGSQALGAGLALASNLLLAARNVAVKMEHMERGENKSSRGAHVRSARVVISTLLMLVAMVTVADLYGHVGLSVALLAASSLFHVVYSHVSTGLVLHFLSVVSHAVANIFKRVLVVLLLYAAGQRSASTWNFLGLVVSSVGLTLYSWDKIRVQQPQQQQQQQQPHHGWTKSLLGGRLGWASALMLAAGVLLLPLGLISHSFIVGHTFLGRQNYALLSRFLQNEDAAAWAGASFRRSFDAVVPALDPSYRSRYAGPLGTVEFQEALKADILQQPLLAKAISQHLNASRDIVEEAQRIHFKLFSELLAGFKYAFLLDMACFENKGDPAITLGEVYLLRRLGIKVVYYCNYYACTDRNLDYAKNLSASYLHKDLVVLIHGGGNLVGYKNNDFLRQKIFQRFPDFQMVLLPQSVYLKPNDTKHLQFCEKLYRNQSNFTMVLRDEHSYALAQKHFAGKPRLLMSPDAAFQIGMVPRFISPVFDILWLKRVDHESPGYVLPSLPSNVTVHVADWWAWKSPKGSNSMDSAAVMATNGFLFLQRGRVVITDRLHGHIMCTLLNIPHVLIDNKQHKLTNYHNTWTRSSDITVVAEDAKDAIRQALALLRRFNASLPPVAVYMDVRENAPTPKPTRAATTSRTLRSPSKNAKTKLNLQHPIKVTLHPGGKALTRHSKTKPQTATSAAKSQASNSTGKSSTEKVKKSISTVLKSTTPPTSVHIKTSTVKMQTTTTASSKTSSKDKIPKTKVKS